MITDRQIDTQNDYRNPTAHAPRVNQAIFFVLQVPTLFQGLFCSLNGGKLKFEILIEDLPGDKLIASVLRFVGVCEKLYCQGSCNGVFCNFFLTTMLFLNIPR